MEENQTPQSQQAVPATPVSVSSPDISKLAAALSKFQGVVEQPKFNKDVNVRTKGGYTYRFKYADFSAVTKAAAPALKETGLSVSQIISGGHLITILLHESGQWLRSDLAIGSVQEYQELGSAITYLKRYSYCAILGIVADADDDGNRNLGNVVEDAKGAQPAKSSQATPANGFTPQQEERAKKDLEMAKDMAEFTQVYQKWQVEAPALCRKGTSFYAACAEKGRALKSSTSVKEAHE